MSDERPGAVAVGSEGPPPGGVVGEIVEDEHRPRSRKVRIAIGATAVIVALLWAWALVYSVIRKDPERLTKAEHTQIVQACQSAQTQLKALPPVSNPPTNESVSTRAAGETQVLSNLVADLRTMHPQRGATAEALSKWLDDWDSILRVRRLYANQVLVDRHAELVLPVDTGAA